jgi:hypothetical protein
MEMWGVIIYFVGNKEGELMEWIFVGVEGRGNSI